MCKGVERKKHFSSSWGFVLAAVGSAVGMANVWGFPAKMGSYGGSAFLIAYLVFIALFGTVGLSAEYAVGRRAKTGTLGSYRMAWGKRDPKLGQAGGLLGWLPLAGSMCIALGYAVIIAYVLKAFVNSVSGALMTADTSAWFESFSLADYSVEVWDQRPEAVTPALFPDAAALRCGAWEAALEALAPVAAEDYVVVMTPGHQADFTVLAQVLKTPAKYIGCIGSRSKAAAVRSRLLEAGFSEEEVDRVRSPIGLPVGGKAPGEIAVSVAAEMIACRYGSPIERSRYASN